MSSTKKTKIRKTVKESNTKPRGRKPLSSDLPREQVFLYLTDEEKAVFEINFVTPEQKHQGKDTTLLKQRDEVYKLAQLNKPERWSKKTRNWSPVTEVELNPENEKQAA